MSCTKTLSEMRDIICTEMKDIYERPEGEDDVGEVLRLGRAAKAEFERRETDARAIIRGMTESLQAQLQDVVAPSDEEFIAKVRDVEEERSQATSNIRQQTEEACAKERDIERMQGAAAATEAEIERTVAAHTVEMPRVQNSIGLYAHITGIKWNYDTDGKILAGWILPRAGSDDSDGRTRDGAVVEGFQFDAAGKNDFEVANKLWDIIDGRARAMVEA